MRGTGPIGPSRISWLKGARLDLYTSMMARAAQEPTPVDTAILDRYRSALQPGLARMAELLATAS